MQKLSFSSVPYNGSPPILLTCFPHPMTILCVNIMRTDGVSQPISKRNHNVIWVFATFDVFKGRNKKHGNLISDRKINVEAIIPPRKEKWFRVKVIRRLVSAVMYLEQMSALSKRWGKPLWELLNICTEICVHEYVSLSVFDNQPSGCVSRCFKIFSACVAILKWVP